MAVALLDWSWHTTPLAGLPASADEVVAALASAVASLAQPFEVQTTFIGAPGAAPPLDARLRRTSA